MIIPTLRVVLLVVAVVCWIFLLRGWGRLRGTTLRGGFALGNIGVGVWLVARAGEIFDAWPPGAVSYAEYFAILALLGGGISILGARNPGAEAWRWFVVAPMFLVLGWPAVLCWGENWIPEKLELMTPAFLGVLLVLVMGAGNYLATRFQKSALWGSLAAVLTIVPMTPLNPSTWISAQGLAVLSEAAACLALLGILEGNRERQNQGLLRLWDDFRDSYGIVWAYRVMERMNQEAERLGWPFRLEIDRIVRKEENGENPSLPHRDGDAQAWDPQPGELSEKARGEVLFTVEWIFRRFVSEEWRRKRLGGGWIPSENES